MEQEMKVVFDSEYELEQYIHDKFIEESICCIDGSAPDYLERQFNCGAYGIADLVAFTFHKSEFFNNVDVVIYELKKEKITADAFIQVARYATAIRQSFEAIDADIDLTITCALVGTSIDESCFILNNSDYLYFKPFFNPNSGVDFEEQSAGWHREDSVIKLIKDMHEFNFPCDTLEIDKK
jgi:RecB family endonuclease NucS